MGNIQSTLLFWGLFWPWCSCIAWLKLKLPDLTIMVRNAWSCCLGRSLVVLLELARGRRGPHVPTVMGRLLSQHHS